MPSILVIGDAAVPTGFSRVISNVFSRLQHRYEIHQLAPGYRGDPHDYEWRLYPAATRGDIHGRNRVAELARRLRPSLIFLVSDLWLAADYLADIDREEFAGIPVVAYCPIEARGFAPEIVLKLLRLRKLVLYTDFGRREIEKSLASVCRDVEVPADFIEVIPHGLDLNIFRPLHQPPGEGVNTRSEKRKAKELLLGADVPADSFYVLNANRNQPRKRIDLTVQAFSLFARAKPPGVKLFLHMGLRDLGWDIGHLAERFNVSERLILTTDSKDLPHVADSQLNLIYNACDVGLSTASAEGWGLVSFEHAATYAPQVVPRHSSYAELWDGAGLLVEPAITIVSTDLMFDHELVAPGEVAQALQLLYEDTVHYDRVAKACYRNAHRPELSWDAIAERWDMLFQSLI